MLARRNVQVRLQLDARGRDRVEAERDQNILEVGGAGGGRWDGEGSGGPLRRKVSQLNCEWEGSGGTKTYREEQSVVVRKPSFLDERIVIQRPKEEQGSAKSRRRGREPSQRTAGWATTTPPPAGASSLALPPHGRLLLAPQVVGQEQAIQLRSVVRLPSRCSRPARPQMRLVKGWRGLKSVTVRTSDLRAILRV